MRFAAASGRKDEGLAPSRVLVFARDGGTSRATRIDLTRLLDPLVSGRCRRPTPPYPIDPSYINLRLRESCRRCPLGLQRSAKPASLLLLAVCRHSGPRGFSHSLRMATDDWRDWCPRGRDAERALSARCIKKGLRETDPTGAKSDSMCGEHQLLDSQCAVFDHKWNLGNPRDHDQYRRAIEDLKIRIAERTTPSNQRWQLCFRCWRCHRGIAIPTSAAQLTQI